MLRISDGSACRLIGDALDLRHRLSTIWGAALSGQVPAYQARRIAAATRHLTAEQAGWVDAELAPSLGALPWGRLQTLLDAKIIEADPVGAEQQAATAAQERFVRLGRASEHGLKLIIARATAGDAIWFKATIDRIADILHRQGDPDPIDIRRSKAIGIFAQPAQALQLLCQHQHQDDDWDGPTEPTNPDQKPSDDEDENSCDKSEHDDGTRDQSRPGRGAATTRDQDVSSGPPRPDRHRRHYGSPAALPNAASDETAETDETAYQSLQLPPPPFHPDRARPRAIIYVHLSEEAVRAGTGVARVEQVGPVLLSRLHTLLGDHCTISLKPVIDLPTGHTPVDGYEIPARLREQLQLRNPADVFPYAAAVSRLIDIDHTIPYLSTDQGGPPGQTSIGNLGPHTRYHQLSRPGAR